MTHTLPDWAKDAIIVCARATWDAGMLEVVGEDRRLRLAAFRAFQFVQTQENKPVASPANVSVVLRESLDAVVQRITSPCSVDREAKLEAEVAELRERLDFDEEYGEGASAVEQADANRELYMQWQAAEAEAVRQRERFEEVMEALRNTSSRLGDELDTARRDRDRVERSRNELLDAHTAKISAALAAELHNVRAERDSLAHLLATEKDNVRRRDEIVARMSQLLAQYLAVGNLTPHYKKLTEELLFEVARLDVPQEKS